MHKVPNVFHAVVVLLVRLVAGLRVVEPERDPEICTVGHLVRA